MTPQIGHFLGHEDVGVRSAQWRSSALKRPQSCSIALVVVVARVAAERVRQTHEPFRFQPMVARDRRVTVSETAAVKAIFGEIPIGGHLPVTIPGIAKRGEGIVRPVKARVGGY